MAEITAALVKELRERTGEGMVDCKKAFTKAGGHIEKAIDDMRASGAIKAAKKAGNVAAEGAISVIGLASIGPFRLTCTSPLAGCASITPRSISSIQASSANSYE